MAKRLCSIDGCGKKHFGKGWCNAHYSQWRTYGDPLFYVKTPHGEQTKFFESVVLKHDSEMCLTWPFAENGRGYGVIWRDKKTMSVHRLVCEIANGPPPTPRHYAAHSCGNGHLGCCAKKHLSWKTPAENAADQILHGTANRGERQGNSKLTQDAVREIRSLAGAMKRRHIAAMFGVRASTITSIQSRKSWRWLE